ncbi:MAG: sugar ABC transporter substrate-binding protein [Cellulomonas sp.]|nr:sugar ABC transporter substrate-binding protein [Cellulomonas sp.]
MRLHRTGLRLTVLAACAALVTATAGCSSSSSPTTGASSDEAVTLHIGNQPAETETAALALFTSQITQFRAAHPTWTIDTSVDGWDAQTFPAKLASGDLPDVFEVPFTEIAGLVHRGQVADITDALAASGAGTMLNPSLVKLASDSDGKVYGVPTSAYALGLVYNRAMFTAAGLDPDTPPATWAEVRKDAASITQATGQAGWAQLTTSNQGGWILTSQIYSRGGTVQDATGSAVTLNGAPARDALQLLSDMRWKDGSVSTNALLGIMDLAQEFAAGKVAMTILQPDAFTPLTTQLGFKAADFGFAPMPTVAAGDPPTTLSGGTFSVVNPKASAAQKAAAVAWIEFQKLSKYTDKDAALADANAAVAAGTPVAIPGLSAVGADQYQQYLTWVSAVNNVPVANFTPYLDKAAQQVVLPEPAVQAQATYALLDPVVQAVLTDQGADIGSLLGQATTSAEALLGR